MANGLSGMDYLNQDNQQPAYGTQGNPARAPAVEGGWGGVLLSGVTALAGVAADNPYLVAAGSAAGQSYSDSYDTLNKSLVEEQRANRLADAALARQKHLAKFNRDLTAEDRARAEAWKQKEFDYRASRDAASDKFQQEKFEFEKERAKKQDYWNSPEGKIEAQKALDSYTDAKFESKMKALEDAGDFQLAADMRGARNAGMTYAEFQQSSPERRQNLRDEIVRAEIVKTEMIDAAAYKRAEQAGASPELLSNIALSQATGIPVMDVPLATKEGREARQEELLKYELDKMEAVHQKTQELSNADFAAKMEELRANPNINSEFVDLMEISKATGIAPDKLLSGTGTGGSGGTSGIKFSGTDIREMQEYYAGLIMDSREDVDIDQADALAKQKVDEMVAKYSGKKGNTLLSMITTKPKPEQDKPAIIGKMTDNALNRLTSRVNTPEELRESVADATPEEQQAVENAILQYQTYQGEVEVPSNQYTGIGALRLGGGGETQQIPLGRPTGGMGGRGQGGRQTGPAASLTLPGRTGGMAGRGGRPAPNPLEEPGLDTTYR